MRSLTLVVADDNEIDTVKRFDRVALINMSREEKGEILERMIEVIAK